jgi:hypothetical protein
MNPPIISILLPSRGRVKQIHRFIDSIIKTANRIDKIELIIYADEDDVSTASINSNLLKITMLVGPREGMGYYHNKCYENSIGEIIFLLNDDVVIQTKGWDDVIRSLHLKYNDEIYLAYPNDLFKSFKCCTFPIISKKVCCLLGGPCPIAYKGSFIDTHLFEIFKRLKYMGHDRIFYLENLIMEHNHYLNKKSLKDETYKSRARFGDDKNYLSLINRRISNAESLRFEITNKYIEPSGVLYKNHNIKNILIYGIFLIFFDRGLPLVDKINHFLWMFLRNFYRFIGNK